MNRVKVLVEGSTELNIVKFVLNPTLNTKGVYLVPALLRGRGGSFRYQRVQREITNALKSEQHVYVTTFVDYYGMPTDWPGRELANACRTVQAKAEMVENALLADIQTQMGDSFNPARFIPYTQMHEFEALLFSSPEILADKLEFSLQACFEDIRSQFSSPEEINDNYDTCPSRRIKQAHPAYDKVADGELILRAIGLDKTRRECPHFNEWITKLESLGQ